MNTSHNDDRQGRELWRLFAESAEVPERRADIDPNVLAAWLDGSATPQEGEAVERAMAARPDLLEAARDLRDLQAAGAVSVPETVLSRAKALSSADAGGQTSPARTAPRAKVLRLINWWSAVAAAAVLVVSAVGYHLGQDASRAQMARRVPLPAELTQALDAEASDGELVALLSGGNGNGGAHQ